MSQSQKNTIYKIGGSCLASDADFAVVAKYLIRASKGATSPVLVVVSAMKGETDLLMAQAREKYTDDPLRQVAHIAEHGEMDSAARLCAELKECGATANFYSPWDTGIQALGSDPFDANLIGMEHEAFAKRARHDGVGFVVLPGYVGVHETFRLNDKPALVALGRGASDLIAVEIARHMGGTARLVKSAGSIYAAPPDMVENPRSITRMTPEQALRMLEYMRPKDQFIMADAVRLAQRHNVVIEFGSMAMPDLISRVDPAFLPGEERLFRALPVRDGVARITAKLHGSDAAQVFSSLAKEGIAFSDAGAALQSHGLFLTVFVETRDATRARSCIAGFSSATEHAEGALLTLIDNSIRPKGQHFLKAYRALEGIPVLESRSSGVILHFLVEEHFAAKAASAMAKAFDLVAK